MMEAVVAGVAYIELTVMSSYAYAVSCRKGGRSFLALQKATGALARYATSNGFVPALLATKLITALLNLDLVFADS